MRVGAGHPSSKKRALNKAYQISLFVDDVVVHPLGQIQFQFSIQFWICKSPFVIWLCSVHGLDSISHLPFGALISFNELLPNFIIILITLSLGIFANFSRKFSQHLASLSNDNELQKHLFGGLVRGAHFKVIFPFYFQIVSFAVLLRFLIFSLSQGGRCVFKFVDTGLASIATILFYWNLVYGRFGLWSGSLSFFVRSWELCSPILF